MREKKKQIRKSINIKYLHKMQKQEDRNIVITSLTNLFLYVYALCNTLSGRNNHHC